MQEYVKEPERCVPVMYNVDVAVCGGGIAGIAAALAATRNNAKVLLIDKQSFIGGLATAGLISGYLPLCDGNGKQVSYGISEELLKLSVAHDSKHFIPKVWKEWATIEERSSERYKVVFNSQQMALDSEELLLAEKVSILYDTKVCDVIIKGNRVSEIIIENKSGRLAVRAKSYVDCTGDADLFWYAKVPTKLFSRGNILAFWYNYYDASGVHISPLGYAEVYDKEGSKQVKILDPRRFSGIEGQENSDFLCMSHARIREELEKINTSGGQREVTSIASMPQFRMTRRMVGRHTLSITDPKICEDSIGIISDWRKCGNTYEIPFSCMISEKADNLIAAGRCISTDDFIWDMTRVIPACAVTGEAAGTAAAISDNFLNLPYKELSIALEKQGQQLKITKL